MITKTIKSRIQQKHDIEANWVKAVNFIPMIGELIVYDPDASHNESRLKIGDGQTLVNNLPFAGSGSGGMVDLDITDQVELVAVRDSSDEFSASAFYIDLPFHCSSVKLSFSRSLQSGPYWIWSDIVITNEAKTYASSEDLNYPGSETQTLQFQLVSNNRIVIKHTDFNIEANAYAIDRLIVPVTNESSTTNLSERISALESKSDFKFKGTAINLQQTGNYEHMYNDQYGVYEDHYKGSFTLFDYINPKTEQITGLIINRTFIPMAQVYFLKNSNTSFSIIFNGLNGEPLGLRSLTIDNITISGAEYAGTNMSYSITCTYDLVPGYYYDGTQTLDTEWTIGFQYSNISLVSPYPEVQY